MIGTSISLGQRDGAMRRLALDRDRPRRGVIMRRGLAGALQPLGQEADGVVVLGMHHDQRAGLARHAHDVEHFDVGERQALIGHEHLERGVAVVAPAPAVPGRARGRSASAMMRWKRHVDVALAVGLRVIVLHHLAQRLRPSAAWRTASPWCCRRTPPSACRSRSRRP